MDSHPLRCQESVELTRSAKEGKLRLQNEYNKTLQNSFQKQTFCFKDKAMILGAIGRHAL